MHHRKKDVGRQCVFLSPPYFQNDCQHYLASDPPASLFVDLVSHGSGQPFEPSALEARGLFRGLVVAAGGGEADRVRLKIPAELMAASDGTGDHLMIYPNSNVGLFHGAVRTLEAILVREAGGRERVIDRHVASIDGEPPDGLSISLAAMTLSDRTRGLMPTLPRRPRPDGHNVAWLADGNRGGLEVLWPPDRDPIPPDVGKTITHLSDDVKKLERYPFVVIDGSVPRALDRPFDLSADPATGGFGAIQTHFFGGVIRPAAVADATPPPVPKAEWEAFLSALFDYWKGGGAVVVIGPTWDAFEAELPVSGAEGQTLRTILIAFEAGLVDLPPGPAPLRVVLGTANTEASAREPFSIATGVDDADQPLPVGPAEWFSSQLQVFFGERDRDGGLPGRQARLGRLARRLTAEGNRGGVVAPEFLTLPRDIMPGSAQEASWLLSARVASLLTHPSVLVERNGVPSWRGAGKRSATPGPVDFPRPFAPGTSPYAAGRVAYPDLFATLFPRLNQPSRDWPSAIGSPPWLDPPEAGRVLVDGMDLTRFAQYLRDQFDKASSGPADPLPPVVLGIFDRDEARTGPSGPAPTAGSPPMAWWPLLAATEAPAPRREAPFVKA